jgi:hypothetical protein
MQSSGDGDKQKTLPRNNADDRGPELAELSVFTRSATAPGGELDSFEPWLDLRPFSLANLPQSSIIEITSLDIRDSEGKRHC